MESSISSPSHEPEPKKLKISSDDETTTNLNSNDPTLDRKPRYKRRKIALFLAYCGVGYQGMQKNPGAKTIEGDLEEALYHCGAVPEVDRGHPKRFDWARSARTDKGVSAVGAVVSGRFYVDASGFIERLNEKLPGQIRVFGFKRVTGSFNAKKFCDRRRYVYLIPVFALDPNCHVDRESVIASLGSDNELVKCLECSNRGRKVEGLMGRRNCGNSSRNAGNGVQLVSETNDHTIKSGVFVDRSGADVSNSETPLESSVVSETEAVTVSGVSLVNNGVVASSSGSPLESSIVSKTESFSETGVALDNSNGVVVSNPEIVLETNACSLEEGNLGSVLVQCNNRDSKETTENESGFCYGEKEMEKFNRILNNYVGTHNFHNFTTRIKAEDPSVIRYIMSFNANSVVTVEGMDFVKCEVVGQSFMLHQIRKMIGLAVAIMRNRAPESLIVTAFQKNVNINIPTAPEVGLYLDECFFSSYNQKWKDTHEEISMKGYEKEAEDFKMKQIYSHIAANEEKYGGLGVWLHSLNHRNYPDLNFKEISGDGTCLSEVIPQIDIVPE
ncbi:hypothetical protein GIB67_007076 [Kingdonia uniflora]|uniref:Pseudouridine synthase I TruA alpha/beta domain-containing protein n=1 Tax=Kingdonia uniflora TaxID=39325 RepID=A0A7J7NZN7_9MAGN|nr:hypothetical protein GIB67_007076 [Kingdonia uniflora]